VVAYHVFLVEVDEGEGQGDVKGAGLVRVCGTFARLEGDHEINPAGWTSSLERFNELNTKDLTE